MKRSMIRVFIAFAVMAGFCVNSAYALNGTETRITTNTFDQVDPAISGNFIVYTDARNGNKDIYLYDLTTHTEWNKTPNTPGDQYLDDVDGNFVVYTDVHSTGSDIVMCDLTLGVDCYNNLTFDGSNFAPAIQGDHVVWVASGSGTHNIVLANLNTWSTTQLTNNPINANVPRVDGDWVVWEEGMGNPEVSQIRAYRISTQEYRTITTDSSSHRRPDVSGNIVVWADSRSGNWDIYSYNLDTHITTQLTNSPFNEQFPRISGNRVVWEDDRSGITQIYTKNLTSGIIEPVSPSVHPQFLNNIDGNRIVWTESRFGNYDIFMFTIAPGPTCGDGACNGTENCVTCSQDCGNCAPTCGNGVCSGSETCVTCPQDCGTCPPACGDGTCNGTETCTSCPNDCGACPMVCGDGACNGLETCATCPNDCGACPASCGDGTCNGTENCHNCPGDCGQCPVSCGDGTCNGNETCLTCPSDCGACPAVCGDSVCNGGETCQTCPNDCGQCPSYCGDGACNGTENCHNCQRDCGACPPSCGDGVCSGGESCVTCPNDCGTCAPACGDGSCNGTENCASCPGDCGLCPPTCGDGVCNGGETCHTCPGDCGACPPVCGDGSCNGTESCKTCPSDCGSCPPACGDGVCNANESCQTCPQDCGNCPPVCGDGLCNGSETCATCPHDCGTCPASCGNGICNGNEDCHTCPGDCGPCPPVCGDGVCNGTETCATCGGDCGPCVAAAGDLNGDYHVDMGDLAILAAHWLETRSFGGTWVGGANVINQPGVYGTKGLADWPNMPGARQQSVAWRDGSGNMYLFGGEGFDVNGTDSWLNDMWKFDGSYWAWLSGSDAVSQSGVYSASYGQHGANYVPGARRGCVSWVTGGGTLMLFGGYGLDGGIGGIGYLNDLWEFAGFGTGWMWLSGSNMSNQLGVYGTKGVANFNNVPGSREESCSWKDRFGNYWLFGGFGYNQNGGNVYLNDLWKFDGLDWTWVAGSKDTMEHGTYGTKGVADPNNSPGARYGSASWVDGSGNLWLFGGWGYAETGAFGGLGDLWKFNGTYWTWVSGAKTLNNVGVYGTKGEPNSANMPGARRGAVSWIDGGGNLWLFGGTGLDSTTWALLNDLWKFDGTKWTWVAGAKLGDKTGAYGTKGFGEPNNIPGSRQDAVVWVDSADNLWLFGGDGYATTGIEGKLNDLWKVRGLNNPKGDLNADGIVNFKDFAILAAHWKQNYLLTLGLTGGRAAGDEPTLREMTNIAGLWLSGK